MSAQVVKFGGWTARAMAHLAVMGLVAGSWMSISSPAVKAQEAAPEPSPSASPSVQNAGANSGTNSDANSGTRSPATFEGNTLKYQTTSSAPEATAPPGTKYSTYGIPHEVPLAEREDILIAGDFVIPPGRPNWIAQFAEAKDQPIGKQVAICSGPYTTEAEARQELNNKARQVADRYIESTLGSPQAPLLLGYSGEQIKSRFVNRQNEYVETVTFSVGPMKQVHALVQFTGDFDHELQHRWRQIRSASRVGVVALVGAVALGVLLTFFGYLRADTSTRGYYTTRLKLAAVGAILAIVVAGLMGSRWVHWL